VDFDIVLVDEASQVTEPTTLIPLVKGCQRAVLVGDQLVTFFIRYGFDSTLIPSLNSVQLRPTVHLIQLRSWFTF
jgi:hypothetical protein